MTNYEKKLSIGQILGEKEKQRKQQNLWRE